ncbi:unnamed protein product [Fusarium graminearum]|uniref:Uncharacterized protein n=1 Tax=Gibberella zeae TaxID=5518 RepID=A0A679NRP7_GIBZA|nr:hypothetical protein FG05_30621 [Fusarium graminearum]CAF3521993.1 unnamed protein product [Fusarium graminearum]CAF3556579.1 unnamed protein product [Fusarium graminearum]CAG1999676.1 unnamed protein product [Fusarium graminearum]CZS79228.1 unnamed protein product [Fusarium graminearum]
MATGWESWTGSATGLFSGGAAGVVTGAGVAVEANRERHELVIWRGIRIGDQDYPELPSAQHHTVDTVLQGATPTDRVRADE